ncbi:uncharacterized protein LOC133879118 [Alnus glutinosa]|uniref:uncharacterized protein LOC133879118 n=1 Tax=Alnus glutinosa TaxID=3517 RepID=UPI002D76EAEC|nr:uncharacterized protein LOC133879118 [Alnus glutinosa]
MRLEKTGEGENQNFIAPLPLPSPSLSLSNFSPYRSLVAGFSLGGRPSSGASRSGRQILSSSLSLRHISFSPVLPTPPETVVRRPSSSPSGRSSPALSLSPAYFLSPALPTPLETVVRRPTLPAPPDSVVRRLPPPANPLQLSLSLRRFSSLRHFPLRQIRSPFSSSFSLGVRRPLSFGRSRPSPALSPADLLSGGQRCKHFEIGGDRKGPYNPSLLEWIWKQRKSSMLGRQSKDSLAVILLWGMCRIREF